MKAHKLKYATHCESCLDKSVKNTINAPSQPTPMLVSSSQYGFIKEFGLSEGLLRWAKSKFNHGGER